MRSTLKCDIIGLRIVGVIYMKTKIIYISGNEIFDMAEIRAAFDEVRDALGLDSDTILFGVPVDKDNAIESTVSTDISTELSAVSQFDTTTEESIAKEEPEQEQETITTITDSQQEVIIENPKTTETEVSEPVDEEKIIPILSILATAKEEKQTEDILETPKTDESENIEDIENTPIKESEIIVQSVSITTEQDKINNNEIVPDAVAEAVVATTEPEDFSDIIDENAPEMPTKKTLEQLLESMKPLREDHGISTATTEYAPEDTAEDMPVFDDPEDSEDATLAQLASEFAESADKIVATPKPENHGKIGKLKNILPFKKAKRDDSGLMGDLFGWAGIAANDEDFSIPGFFTKKQGA